MQRQEQTQSQTQRTAAVAQLRQMMQSRLAELPVAELASCISAELDDNPALEPLADPDDGPGLTSGGDSGEGEPQADDRSEAIDDALRQMAGDDEMPAPAAEGARYEPQADETFLDTLLAQVTDLGLTPRERTIAEYIIGSLDDDGLLRKSSDTLSDELALFQSVEATEAEVEAVVRRVQSMDPAGLAARTLQECLLLQIARRPDSRLKSLMRQTIADHYDDFIHKRRARLGEVLGLDEAQADTLMAELCRLNPKPGSALGESSARATREVTPDIYIDTADDGTISLSVNTQGLPRLGISPAFTDAIAACGSAQRTALSRQEREALAYSRQRVSRARLFISALEWRHRSLQLTARAIIARQRAWFADGDEASLRPMTLKDVAADTGLDISTVSRVCNSKWAQTRWGVVPLRHFFTEGYTVDGQELSTRAIKAALADLVAAESKASPLSDEALAAALASQGYPIARRTVAKYREQLGIPKRNLRR